MVLNYFLPNRDYSWDELDRLTGKREGKWTWPLRSIGKLHDLGFDVKMIVKFDYAAFFEQPEKYLIERYGDVAGRELVLNSDIPYELEVTKKYLGIAKNSEPTLKDLENFLDHGSLPICGLNLPTLYEESGSLSHFVLLLDFDRTSIWLHDPGVQNEHFPGRQAVKVSHATFMNAWSMNMLVFGVGKTT